MDKGGRHLAVNLLRLPKRFITEPRGSVAVILALSLPVLLGLVGLAIDVVKMEQLRARLQTLSDAAAVAAARELSLPNAKISQIKSVVANSIAAHAGNGWEPVSNSVHVDAKAQKVRVGLAQDWVPFFAQFLDASVTPIAVQSTARLLTATTKTCVLSLNPTEAKGIYLDQSAVITANDCGIYANSTDKNAIWLNAQSEMTASLICAAGGIKLHKTDAANPPPLSDCPAVPDPLALRNPPPVGSCGPNKGLVINTGTVTFRPEDGPFCDGLTIGGDAHVTFLEGEYVIKGGIFRISQDAVVKGENVGFYLTGKKAVFHCTENATIELSGRKSGSMAGLLFFEDRAATLGQLHKINCTNANTLTGTIYLPRGELKVDPNSSVAQESAYTAIIVNRLELYEGPDLVLNSDYDATNVPVPDGLKSVGTVVLTE